VRPKIVRRPRLCADERFHTSVTPPAKRLSTLLEPSFAVAVTCAASAKLAAYGDQSSEQRGGGTTPDASTAAWWQ